jgi:glucose/arabinose dehydrogenase
MAAVLAFAAASCTSGSGGTGASTGLAGQLVDIGAGLRGPAGLKAELYAQGHANLSDFAVDSKGRLWFSTAAYDDTGTDGLYLVAARGATPAEALSHLHTPLGLLWVGQTLYVASSERVDAYRGFDGTRFISHTTILTLPSGVGENNDLVLAPDGRLQMGISSPCDDCTPSSRYSAAVVSFRPDGTDLEVDASGLRAPVGLAYYPHSDDLLVTMDQRDDLGAKTTGDWVGVVRRGQDWGFPACYGQGGAACRGVPSPTAVLDVHGGVDGIAVVAGQLGAIVGTSAIVAEWNTGVVQQVRLTRRGADLTGEVTPFLTGMTHPTPVVMTPDGHLLVGDWATGRIYEISSS